jgi:hypothetical protein
LRINYGAEFFDSTQTVTIFLEKPRQYQLTPEMLRAHRGLLDWLAPIDRDVCYLLAADLGPCALHRVMGSSQPLMTYLVCKLSERVQMIMYLHSQFDAFCNFLEGRARHYTTEQIENLTALYYTGSYADAARIIAGRQLKKPFNSNNKQYLRTKYSLTTAICLMAFLKHWDMYELFTTIVNNLALVRRFDRSEIVPMHSTTKKKKPKKSKRLPKKKLFID